MAVLLQQLKAEVDSTHAVSAEGMAALQPLLQTCAVLRLQIPDIDRCHTSPSNAVMPCC